MNRHKLWRQAQRKMMMEENRKLKCSITWCAEKSATSVIITTIIFIFPIDNGCPGLCCGGKVEDLRVGVGLQTFAKGAPRQISQCTSIFCLLLNHRHTISHLSILRLHCIYSLKK